MFLQDTKKLSQLFNGGLEVIETKINLCWILMIFAFYPHLLILQCVFGSQKLHLESGLQNQHWVQCKEISMLITEQSS